MNGMKKWKEDFDRDCKMWTAGDPLEVRSWITDDHFIRIQVLNNGTLVNGFAFAITDATHVSSFMEGYLEALMGSVNLF
jgi:hypothetical protein